MHKTFIAGALAASLAAGAALAQKPSDTTPSNATMQPPAGTSAGFATSKTGTQPVQFSNVQGGDMMTSKLVGVNVYNKSDEKVGEISDIAIDNGRTVKGIVLSVGGFLGIGERYVLVQPQSLALTKDGNSWKAYVDTTKDSLKNAPTFEYKS